MATILTFPRSVSTTDASARQRGEHTSSAEIYIFTGSRTKTAKPERPRSLRPFFPALFPLMMLPLTAGSLEEAEPA
jgi:hypothetical protein